MAAIDSFRDGEPIAPRQLWIVEASLLGALLLTGTLVLWTQERTSGLLFLVGAAIGWTLYRSSFGFASAYRNLIRHRAVGAIVAQLLLIGLTTILFAPLLANGEFFGQKLRGATAPIALSGAFGALLFGIGMQLGGACGCGTLFSLGGGRLASLITLIAFGLGAFVATWTRTWFANWYSRPPIVLGESWGWTNAVLFQLLILGGLALVLRRWVGRPEAAVSTEPHSPVSITQRLLRQPWSWTTGAVLLAVMSVLVLILSGQPWRLTWGFLLATAKALTLVGFDVSVVPFWASKGAQKSLAAGVWADSSFLTSAGLILGAALAAAIAGGWKPVWKLPARAIIAHLFGGLLMGYGAFIAAGCNVNAFLGGLASTSLHGWMWIASALIGTVIGLKLPPLFQLDAASG